MSDDTWTWETPLSDAEVAVPAYHLKHDWENLRALVPDPGTARENQWGARVRRGLRVD